MEQDTNGDARRRGGYRPLALTLVGFKGIKEGLGRDELALDLESLAGDATLVAIAGANGRGKSTLIDNLHPWLVMPSRAGADGLGAFSYYDHVFLPESQKVLVWEHHGQRFRTHLVFRLGGRRRTEAYLLERQGDAWTPVKLADGTVSDGKADTYERAVRDILGSPETFFTSAFSAQGRRPLSAYRNGEIKALLADLLGLDAVLAQGARASEVVRLLKQGLGMLRQEHARLESEAGRLAPSVASIDAAAAVARAALAAKTGAANELQQARQAQAEAAAAREATKDTEQRRADLRAAQERSRAEAAATRGRLALERASVAVRAKALSQRMHDRRREHGERRLQLDRQQRTLVQACGAASRVRWACRRLALAEQVERARRARLDAADERAREEAQIVTRGQAIRQEAVALRTQVGQLVLRQRDLAERFGLTAEVPCAGSALQGRCKLLGDARAAKALQPSVEGQLAALKARMDGLALERSRLKADYRRVEGAARQLDEARRRVERASRRVMALATLAAREGEMGQAEAALAAIRLELAAQPASAPAATHEEAAEQAEIDAASRRLEAEEARAAAVSAQTLAELASALAALPAPPDPRQEQRCGEAVAGAERALADAEERFVVAVRRHEGLEALRGQLQGVEASLAQARARASRVEGEIGKWSLLARCLSHDGVVALDIDDAGPTLAGLANDLLLACYGPHLTVEIRTQVHTAKGEAREDFDVQVHDGRSGESKSIGLHSGGERVWLNECLTRAIALYLAAASGRESGTLFCDETDGPLDPQRKRMFMAMKRRVLEIGGFRQEYFVSQTPELTAMADCVIDLDAMAATMEEARC